MDLLREGPCAVSTHSQCHPGREVVEVELSKVHPLCLVSF